jgi:hypothetical protein
VQPPLKCILLSCFFGLTIVTPCKRPAGGTALEAAAAKSGVTWGCCRTAEGAGHCQNAFRPKGGELTLSTVRLPHSTPLSQYSNCAPWHTPHHWFQPDYYQGSDTFVVVRNPYARAVSEFYSPWGGFGGDDVCKRRDPSVLNGWIQYAIDYNQQSSNCGHMLPQHYYVFDDSQRQVTTHVLHYEHLHEEFQALVNAYKLNISLPPTDTYMVGKYVEDSPKCTTTKLTIANLSSETIHIINEFYGPSFELFGYARVNSPSEFFV